MSSSSSETLTGRRTGFLERDINKFMQQGATLSAGTAGTQATTGPKKVTQTFETIARRRRSIFGPAVGAFTGSGTQFSRARQVGGPVGDFSDIGEDQLADFVQAFEGRRQQIRQRLRRPGTEQTRLAV
jgi:hypothetical protein